MALPAGEVIDLTRSRRINHRGISYLAAGNFCRLTSLVRGRLRDGWVRFRLLSERDTALIPVKAQSRNIGTSVRRRRVDWSIVVVDVRLGRCLPTSADEPP